MANICCSRNETMAKYYAGSPKSDMEVFYSTMIWCWTNQTISGYLNSISWLRPGQTAVGLRHQTFPSSNVIRADLLEVIRPSGVIRSVGF